MSRGTVVHVVLVAAYGLGAVAVGWIAPAEGTFERMLVGALTFVAAALLHEVIVRRLERRETGRELARLRRAQQAGRDDVAGLQLALGFDPNAESAPDIIGEMRVIRGLLKKLTDRSLAARDRAQGGIAQATAATPVEGELSADEILGIIRLGLESNRVDLYLQPVVTLPQRKVRYYEAFSRIRTEQGSVLLPDQYLGLAAESGLLTMIDNLLLFRCIQLVRRVRRDKLDVGVLCNLSRAALADPDFFPQFVEFLEQNPELPDRLVFELSQDDAGDRTLDASLARIRKLGFALSLDKVMTLALNLDDLARRNFRFVKIEAARLLSEDAQRAMTIHIADLKETCRRAGIEIIAEKVETEPEVVGLLDLGIDLAQGFLFGEPRPVHEGA